MIPTDPEVDKRLEETAFYDFKELTQSDLQLWSIEVAVCQADFRRFLKWVRIAAPPIPGQTGGGIRPFEVLPHIDEMITILSTCPLISVLKARQIYISTTMSAYHLWMALSRIGSTLLLFSKGQPEAKELLLKSRRIYDLLPAVFRFKIDPDSTEELGFPIMTSCIKAFPSTASASISYTASLVTCDEHAQHPYADENYTSSKPTRDKGGQFISVFTADPYSNDNLATAIFMDALAGKNDFKPVFFPYTVIKDRTQEWYDQVKRNVPERDLVKLSPDLYMAKNYPRSIEEALSLTSDSRVFDRTAVNRMMQDTHAKVNDGWENLSDHCNVYKDFQVGRQYVAASDVSLGVGNDFNVTCIMDVVSGEIVADVMSSRLQPDAFAYESFTLLERFRRPVWWIEENLWGRMVIKRALELGYRNLGYRDSKKEKPGFVTDERTRSELFGALISAVNGYQIRVFNASGLAQFYDIIRNAGRGGKPEARSGAHDDYVIAAGICCLKREEITRYSGQMTPVATLTFGGRE